MASLLSPLVRSPPAGSLGRPGDEVAKTWAACPACGLGDLWRIQPFATLWSALGTFFRDPRLRQLFGRYATYCGASPFTARLTAL